MCLTSAAMFIFIFIHRDDFEIYLAIAVVFTAVACWVTHRAFANFKTVCFTYSTGKFSVGNKNVKTKIKNSINLEETCYLTKTVSEIAVGKSATTKLPQVLISQNPFPKMKDPSEGGLMQYGRLAEQHIVFIPLDENTNAWLADEFNITQIPEYPKVMCKMAKMEDPGDSLNLWQ